MEKINKSSRKSKRKPGVKNTRRCEKPERKSNQISRKNARRKSETPNEKKLIQ
jgi:hypothetical protein